jgi:hypothetical protein
MKKLSLALLTFAFCLLFAPACSSPPENTDKAGTASDLPTNVKGKVPQGGKKPAID